MPKKIMVIGHLVIVDLVIKESGKWTKVMNVTKAEEMKPYAMNHTGGFSCTVLRLA